MKNIIVILVCLFFAVPAMLIPTSVSASSKSSPFYLAIKGGFMNNGGGLADSPINLGVGGGYQWGTHAATEIEYTNTIVDGDNNGTGNNFSIDTFSAYAAFRTRTPIRVKVKAGLTSINGGGISEFEFSYGLGLGFRQAGTLIEAEYTVIDAGLDFISIGVVIFF